MCLPSFILIILTTPWPSSSSVNQTCLRMHFYPFYHLNTNQVKIRKGNIKILTSILGPRLHDPIDECMLHYFSKLSHLSSSVVTLHDFQLSSSRRPRILVQTAGHVSGAVTFYQPQHYPQLSDKKYYPVCHHPVWGGWFALRGVAIFPDIQCPSLSKAQSQHGLSDEDAVEMLALYNECWQDWRWRDVGRGEWRDKYSEQQIKYFETLPAERFKIIDDYVGEQTEEHEQSPCPS